jgi:TonB family protein
MPLKFYLVFLFSILLFNTFAQKPNIYFLKNDDKEVSTRDSADYIRIISEPDSGSNLYNVNEYYKNGNTKLVGKTSSFTDLNLEGQCIRFFPSKKRQEVANYIHGDLFGDVYDYYPNGQLHSIIQYGDTIIMFPMKVLESNNHLLIKLCNDSTGKSLVFNGNGHFINYSHDFSRITEEGNVKSGLQDGEWKGNFDYEKNKISYTEIYRNGRFISGKSVDKDGKQYHYSQHLVNPKYKGGESNFGIFLQMNLKYPALAKRNNIQGKAYITFVVETDGSVTNAKILKSPNNALGQEALRVINLTSGNWKTGYLLGIPEKIPYIVPINFSLSDQ